MASRTRGTRLADSLGNWQERMLLLALAMLAPPYWINMGGIAITTMAGATLFLSAPTGSFLVELVPFLKTFTLFFWAFANWWIPLLVILGI